MLDFVLFFMMPMHIFQSYLHWLQYHEYDVLHDTSKFHYLKKHLLYLHNEQTIGDTCRWP